MKSNESRNFDSLSFLFFFLFASVFIFGFIINSQDHLGLGLLILSFIGILGITWSLIHEKSTWMYAIPSLIVILLLIITYIVRVTVQNSMPSGSAFQVITLAVLSNALYFTLPTAVTILLIGFSVSGLNRAGSLAILTGIFSIVTIPFIFDDLVKIQDLLHESPILVSGNIAQSLYTIFIMPIIGVTLLWVGCSLQKSGE